MKKIIALSLTLALALSLAACSSAPAGDSTVSGGDSAVTDDSAVVSTAYKTGVGAVVKASPKDATADKDGSVQIDTTLVAASFDADGKIVSCTIDTAQQKGTFDAKGVVTSKEIDVRTKNEKGEDYGMKGISEIGKELNEQHEALAQWMVGKTVAEVKAMKTFERDENHTMVPEEEDLKATVTVTVGDYIAALEKAEANATETTGVPATTGLGVVVSPSTKDATADKDGSVQIDSTFVVASFDADGKIVSCTIDTAQQKGTFTAAGVAGTEIDLRTKNEKGEDYGMKGISEIGKELNEQHEALAAWMIGKTLDEVKAMKTFERDENHTAVPEEEDLKASVTVTVGDYIAALEKAATNAR